VQIALLYAETALVHVKRASVHKRAIMRTKKIQTGSRRGERRENSWNSL
jgi:hypothetical protein